MALATYRDIWGGVLLRCPLAGAPLARQWVSHAFQRLAARHDWSWLWKEGLFHLPDAYQTGTVSVSINTTTVTGVGTAWDATMEGRQIRISGNTPIYTIDSVTDATHLELTTNWGGATVATQNYKIYVAYVTVPTDFHSFITIVDMVQGWQLPWWTGQDELDFADPWRQSSGTPWLLSFHDYTEGTANNAISPPLPRYEVWPHVFSVRDLNFLYETRAVDLQDSGATLPRYIRGDILMEMALAECARWPGPDGEKKNPYFNMGLADRHDRRAEDLISVALKNDQDVAMQNVRYQRWQGMPFALDAMGSNWWQKHEVYPY